jgi:hypothetical protein
MLRGAIGTGWETLEIDGIKRERLQHEIVR